MIWLWLLALIVTGNFERQFPPQFYCKKKKIRKLTIDISINQIYFLNAFKQKLQEKNHS